MKVLVADKFEEIGLQGLKDLGLTVESQPNLSGDELGAAIKSTGANILVVRSTKVTADMMEGSSLSVIIRAGAGYNTIDVTAAANLGIFVCNCPGKNSYAVAELAMGLLIACDRHIPDNVSDLREGKWNKKLYSNSKGLYGRTLGLIGMGSIGQAMIPRAKAFGMHVIAYSRWMTPDVAAALGIGRASSLKELATQCDALSVHVSLTNDTRGILNAEFFDAVKPGTLFVNTSRAEVVDQAALLYAVESGKVIAGLDVFEGEPSGGEGTYEGALKNARNVYCTHHIGASTEEAQNAVALEVVRIVKEFKSTGMPPNTVNMPSQDATNHVLVVRHADRVGVLATVLSLLKDEGVNVQEMENIVLGPSHAAIAQIAISKDISDQAMNTLKMHPNIFDVQVLGV